MSAENPVVKRDRPEDGWRMCMILLGRIFCGGGGCCGC